MSLIDLCWFVFWIALGILLYSHGFYPVLMAVCARFGRRVPESLSSWPTVSLIIPAHDESLVIEAKLENSLAIDYPFGRLEILVASDGSNDDTVERARPFESDSDGVRVLDFDERRGKASVLNDAVADSTGEVLCLCDANVMFRSDAIRRMLVHLTDPTIGAVTGDVRLASEQSDFGAGESLYYRLERAIQLGESQVGSLVCVDGGMYVMRRELYQRLPADTILDDFTTTMNVIRQGKRVVYEPSAIADENGTPHWRDEYRRRVRTMVGGVQSVKRGLWPPLTRPVVFWQYLSHKFLRWLGPIWLGGLLLTSCLLWQAGTLMHSLVIAQGSIYGIAFLASVSRPLRRTRVGGILFYFAMSHVAMAEGLVRGLGGRPSGVWRRTFRAAPIDPMLSTTANERQGHGLPAERRTRWAEASSEPAGIRRADELKHTL